MSTKGWVGCFQDLETMKKLWKHYSLMFWVDRYGFSTFGHPKTEDEFSESYGKKIYLAWEKNYYIIFHLDKQ